MKSFKALLIFLFCSFTLLGQNNLSITGTLVDDITKEPVDLATISLLNSKDSSFVSGAMSNEKGVFTLRGISKGNYLINVKYIGYKNIYQPVTLSGSKSTTNTGTISLITDDILLAETVIEGKIPDVVVKGDTIEFDADAYKTPQNAALEELLKKLPGAEVDKDGKITINGKDITKILVEGKEFFSDDPQVASKNLPAEMVKKIQVLDQKSDMARLTGFDDGEEETVINLTFQEGMKKGTIGNAMVGLGNDINGNNGGDLRYEAGALLNHMTDNDRYTVLMSGNNTNNMGASDLGGSRFGGMRGMRRGSGGINTSENFAGNMNKEFSPELSLNGDISYNSSDRDSHNKSETDYDEGVDPKTGLPIKLRESTINNNNDISDNFNVRFRMEWEPDTNTTIIFRPTFSYNKSNSTEDSRFSAHNMLLSDVGQDTLYQGNSRSYNWGEGYQVGGRLEYARRLNKPGRVITLSVNGNYNTSYSRGEYNYLNHVYREGVYDSDSLVTQQLENDNYSTRYGFRVTYVEPIGRNNFIQASYRLNKDYSESVNSTYDLDSLSNPGNNMWAQNKPQSRSNVRDNLTQQINLSFRAVREKYNYTIGLNLDPSKSTNNVYEPFFEDRGIFPEFAHTGRFPNVMGDSLSSEVKQNVINFSPDVNFNYLFGQRTNLRIDYEGEMEQPTANQLSILDETNPKNIIRGNPDLKPSYSSRFSARFQKFVPESQFFYNIDFRGGFLLNDIVQVRTINPDGGKTTTYKNMNGNWNAQLRGMFNTPLRNKKFTVRNMVMSSYQNMEGYTNDERNTTKNFALMDRGNINYRSDLFDIGINAGISYQNVDNKLQPDNNKNTYDYSAGGYTTWYLPYNFTVESDIDCQFRNGYEAGYNQSQTIWNASVSKQLFNLKAGAGTIKLKIYDILQDRKGFSYNIGNGFITNRASSTIPSFFMCSFIYKFQKFPGGNTSAEDMQNEFRGGRGQGFRGGQGGRF